MNIDELSGLCLCGGVSIFVLLCFRRFRSKFSGWVVFLLGTLCAFLLIYTVMGKIIFAAIPSQSQLRAGPEPKYEPVKRAKLNDPWKGQKSGG